MRRELVERVGRIVSDDSVRAVMEEVEAELGRAVLSCTDHDERTARWLEYRAARRLFDRLRIYAALPEEDER